MPVPAGASAEIAELRAKLREAEETIAAIRTSGVDTVLAGPPGQERLYSLSTADRAYRLIVESMSEGAVTVSAAGLIIEANPYLAAMTGRPAAELAGLAVGELVTPASRASFATLIGIEPGQAARAEAELAGPHGGVPVTIAVSAFELDGMPLRCLVFTDLSDQRRAEQQLAGAARYNRSLIDASMDLLFAVDGNGVITDANAATAEVTGYRSDELIGTSAATYLGNQQTFRSVLASAFATGGVRNFPARSRARDGHTTHLLCSATVYRDAAGDPAGVVVSGRDVSAIRTSEAALQRSEGLLRAAASYNRSLIEASPDPLVTIDRDGRLTDVNAAVERATGYPRSELVGTEFAGYFTDPSRARAGYQAVFREGTVRDYPLELRHRDGTSIPVLYNASVYRDPAGQVTGVFAAARDMSEVRKAEAALRASEERLRAIFEQAPVGIAEIGLDGRILRANSYYARILRKPADAMVGQPASDFVHPEDRAADAEATARLTAGTGGYQRARRFIRADESVGWLEVSRSVVRDQKGNPLRLISTGREITEERAAQEALRESKERLQAIVSNAPVGIDEIDPSGRVVSGNPQFYGIVGYPRGELLGRPLSEIVHPDDRATDQEHTGKLLAGEIPFYSLEKRFVRKDGRVVWAQVSRALVRKPDGEPERIVGVVRDITEQRRAEATVRELNADLERRVEQRTAELERANQNMEAFTYSVSHDLRAPLRALSGFSEALVEEYAAELGETGQGYAQRIIAASERMAMLIDDLLHLSRVSRAEMNVRPVDLSAEAAAIGDELHRRDPGRTVRLSVQDGVWVLADAVLIRSVVQNLLENAWKFTGKRAGAAIEFGARPDRDGMLDCYVRDNGAGFDPGYGAKLFQPFQRLHAAADFPGTGIGLASVRRIVERHGGRAWAEGAVGAGATFHVTLPAAGPAPGTGRPPRPDGT